MCVARLEWLRFLLVVVHVECRVHLPVLKLLLETVVHLIEELATQVVDASSIKGQHVLVAIHLVLQVHEVTLPLHLLFEYLLSFPHHVKSLLLHDLLLLFEEVDVLLEELHLTLIPFFFWLVIYDDRDGLLGLGRRWLRLLPVTVGGFAGRGQRRQVALGVHAARLCVAAKGGGLARRDLW